MPSVSKILCTYLLEYDETHHFVNTQVYIHVTRMIMFGLHDFDGLM